MNAFVLMAFHNVFKIAQFNFQAMVDMVDTESLRLSHRQWPVLQLQFMVDMVVTVQVMVYQK